LNTAYPSDLVYPKALLVKLVTLTVHPT
jgi:hypothetical protein